MTQHHDFDDTLRAWVDIGEVRLPAHHLEQALAEIEITRQRGARPALLEDVLMRVQPIAVPLAIAAVLVVVVGALALVNGPSTIGPDPSATPSSTPASTSEAPASPTPEASSPAASSTPSSATKTLEGSTAFPFTMTVPANWTRSEHNDSRLYRIDTELGTSGDVTDGRWVYFWAPDDERSVEERVNGLTSNANLLTSDPAPVTIGGASGFAVDTRVNPDDPPTPDCWGYGRCFRLTSAGGGIYFLPERQIRLWIIDLEGQTTVIGTTTRETAFEDWVAIVEDALATLEWE